MQHFLLFILSFVLISNLAVDAIVAGQSWSLANFNAESDPYKALGGVADAKRTKMYRSIVTDPLNPGRKVLAIRFEKGALQSNSKGGNTFYASPAAINWNTARQVTFCYEVMFSSGFAFARGGKLPGLHGGPRKECKNPPNCWSTRYMWRENGIGEIYPALKFSSQPANYCPDPAQCQTGPSGVGDSVGRATFQFTAGKWSDVCQTVKLNTKGQKNGSLQVVVDGKEAINLQGLHYSDTVGFTGIVFHNFFGGGDRSYACPKAQSIMYANFRITAN